MRESTQSLRDRLLEHLGRENYRPLKQHELARALRLKAAERAPFRHVLSEMERKGEIACLRKNRWALPDRERQLTGRLRMNAQGFGFVTPDGSAAADLFVGEKDLGTALDGDRVVVAVTGSRRAPRRRGPPLPDQKSGRVVRVAERAHGKLVGLLRRTAYYSYVIPDHPRIFHNVRVREIAEKARGARENHKVLVTLDAWENARQALTGVVEEDLGPADAAGVDMLSVLKGHGLEPDFPSDATREAARHSPAPPEAETARRRDLRGLLTFTMDPEDAKDFDDAVSLTRTAEGHWCLGVHIADVGHYVTKGSAVDREALLRGNSVYLVDRVVPMLPPHLTTDVCSLQPLQDRLTRSVIMVLDAAGRPVSSETCPSVIRSSARLNYDQVQALFEGADGQDIPLPVREVLGDMRALARVLRGHRMEAGSIDLSIPEVRCVLDPRGRPVAIRKRVSNEAYQLIEEFMLQANCVVARRLCDRRVPSLYRIHAPPDDKQWAKMDQDLQALGIHDGPATRDGLNAVARAAKGRPMEYSVHLALLRNLKRAMYSAIREEHFGLAFPCYTHFTSPIRRYPDLVVHRILRAVEEHRPAPYAEEEAARIAEHCSATEQNADEAEEESVTIKRVEFYAALLQRREVGPFGGLIVSVVPKGLIVELADSLQRGLLPLCALRDDTYAATDARDAVVGRRHRRAWRVGQSVQVNLARVDTARRLVDFYLGAGEGETRRGKKERRRKYRAQP